MTSMTFKQQILRGSLWSVFGNSGQQIIGFGIFIYIARTVTPADVGLVALAMVMINILAVFSRFGQVQVLQREAEVSETSINTSFWLLVGAGLVATAAVFGVAEIVATVSTEKMLPTIIMLLAPICALQAWSAVPEAVLRRRLDYRSLSFRSWMAALSGGAVGVFLAYKGYGVYALVAQRLGTVLVQTIAAWLFLSWHPRFVFDRSEARRLAVVGTEIMLTGLANVLNLRISDGIAGFLIGTTQLGYLRLGWRFHEVIQQVGSNPVTNVALTAFARARSDGAALNRTYLRLTQFMASASFPLFFGLAAVADVMVPVVFGAKWVDSVIVLQLLCLLNLAGTVNSFFAPAMVVMGRSRYLLQQATIQVAMTIVFIFVGAQFGLVGVMTAFITRALMIAGWNLRRLNREMSLSIVALAKILAPPLAASLVMVAVVRLAKAEFQDVLASVPLLAFLVAVGAVTYGSVLVSGDFAGLWRGYIRDAVGSLRGGLTREGGGVAVTLPSPLPLKAAEP